ncbi:MAG: acyl carrier protein [bacterium]|nr:acyl carrier protein [bacterium]
MLDKQSLSTLDASSMRDKIKETIAQAVGLDVLDLEEEAIIKEDLGIEPAALSDLLETLKQDLGIDIPPEELNEIETVGELVDLAENHVQD